MLEIFSFYLFSALIIFCFSVTIFTSNVLYAMTSVASGMIFIAGIFFTLGAEFLGVVQISVYTGSIIAVYAFAMMFFDSSKDIRENNRDIKIVCFIAVCIATLMVITICLPRLSRVDSTLNKAISMLNITGNIEQVGIELFTTYLLAFELAAIMLLVAMIAGIALVSKNIGNKDDDIKEKV